MTESNYWDRPHSPCECWAANHPAPRERKLSKEEQLKYVSADQHRHPHRHDTSEKLMRIEFQVQHDNEADCPGHTEAYAWVPNPFYVAPTRSVPPRMRFAVLNRDGFKCRYCGRGTDQVLQIDHVVPVARGGLTTISNLVTACSECNSGKSDHQIVSIDNHAPEVHDAP